MKIRLIGRNNLIKSIVEIWNLNVRIYPDRGDYRNSRIYLEIKDQTISGKLQEIAKLFIYLDRDTEE